MFPCFDAECPLPATGHFFQIQNGKLIGQYTDAKILTPVAVK